ncbi:hypothetical protein BC829DRAFT_409359 [Chytridium lagenaria]|nr:hypothetical protein BC829DRAFT_409359 [Chytridium lagenaria]
MYECLAECEFLARLYFFLLHCCVYCTIIVYIFFLLVNCYAGVVSRLLELQTLRQKDADYLSKVDRSS